MNQDWCLIKNGVIVNIIIADDSFIDQIRSQYDDCFVRPDYPVGPGFKFNPDTGKYEG